MNIYIIYKCGKSMNINCVPSDLQITSGFSTSILIFREMPQRSSKTATGSCSNYLQPYQAGLFFCAIRPFSISSPIGSMYGIYANIGGILMVNVTIYSIHGSNGSYGSCKPRAKRQKPGEISGLGFVLR